MASGYAEDKAWSDRFTPAMQQILKDALVTVGVAPPKEDKHHNTDLIVFRVGEQRIACRVRSHADLWYRDYRNEFTIRSVRPRGRETELQKMLSGWGDLFLYGFADADDAGLEAWLIGDLEVFRSWYHQQIGSGLSVGKAKVNKDGSSDFLVCRVADLPPEFIIARKEAVGAGRDFDFTDVVKLRRRMPVLSGLNSDTEMLSWGRALARYGDDD